MADQEEQVQLISRRLVAWPIQSRRKLIQAALERRRRRVSATTPTDTPINEINCQLLTCLLLALLQSRMSKATLWQLSINMSRRGGVASSRQLAVLLLLLLMAARHQSWLAKVARVWSCCLHCRRTATMFAGYQDDFASGQTHLFESHNFPTARSVAMINKQPASVVLQDSQIVGHRNVDVVCKLPAEKSSFQFAAPS